MDELEFRRAIYADPNSKSDDLRAAAKEDPSKQEFWAELKRLDQAMDQASQVEVPDNLANKLIWQQNMHRFAEQKRKSRVHLAMAATVAFVVGVSFTMFQQGSPANLSDQALAHIYHAERYEYGNDANLSTEQVNNKLARLVSAHFDGELGHIFSANYCELDDIKTLHLVVDSKEGPISLFVIPQDEPLNTRPAFSDERFKGRTIDFDRASLIIVGEKNQSLGEFESKVKEKLVFSA